MQEPGRKALFVIAKHWRPHKCPPARERYILRPGHSVQYRVALKWNETEAVCENVGHSPKQC